MSISILSKNFSKAPNGIIFFTNNNLTIRTKNKPVKRILSSSYLEKTYETFLNTHAEQESGFRICILK